MRAFLLLCQKMALLPNLSAQGSLVWQTKKHLDANKPIIQQNCLDPLFTLSIRVSEAY